MRVQKNVPEQLKLADFADKSLLILDDDDPLRGRLARAMEKKGFQVKEAKSVAGVLILLKQLLQRLLWLTLGLRMAMDWMLLKNSQKIKKIAEL